jgi:hypothetical protein
VRWMWDVDGMPKDEESQDERNDWFVELSCLNWRDGVTIWRPPSTFWAFDLFEKSCAEILTQMFREFFRSLSSHKSPVWKFCNTSCVKCLENILSYFQCHVNHTRSSIIREPSTIFENAIFKNCRYADYCRNQLK